MSNIYDALNKSKEGTLERPQAPAPPAPGGASRAALPGSVDPVRDRELEAIRQRVLVDVGPDRSPVLAFTGAVPGEGVTTLAVHFAHDLAVSEQRPVLLVDADLATCPTSLTGILHAGGEPPAGLTDLLAERVALSGVVLATDHPFLHFLPSGREAGPPMDLFRPDRVQRIFREQVRCYSFVVIDAGASLQAPEAALLAGSADGVVMVVRANRTRREVIQKAVHVLSKTHCHLLGLVLNERRYPIPEFLYRRI